MLIHCDFNRRNRRADLLLERGYQILLNIFLSAEKRFSASISSVAETEADADLLLFEAWLACLTMNLLNHQLRLINCKLKICDFPNNKRLLKDVLAVFYWI